MADMIEPFHIPYTEYNAAHSNPDTRTEDINLSSAATDWSDNPYKAVSLSLVQK